MTNLCILDEEKFQQAYLSQCYHLLLVLNRESAGQLQRTVKYSSGWGNSSTVQEWPGEFWRTSICNNYQRIWNNSYMTHKEMCHYIVESLSLWLLSEITNICLFTSASSEYFSAGWANTCLECRCAPLATSNIMNYICAHWSPIPSAHVTCTGHIVNYLKSQEPGLRDTLSVRVRLLFWTKAQQVKVVLFQHQNTSKCISFLA